jgi:hypothetical protein
MTLVIERPQREGIVRLAAFGKTMSSILEMCCGADCRWPLPGRMTFPSRIEICRKTSLYNRSIKDTGKTIERKLGKLQARTPRSISCMR